MKKKCDTIWSIVIKERDKKCVICGKPAIHAHHLITRGVNSIRHNPDNGVGLCAGCHMMAHLHPLKFIDLLPPETQVALVKLKEYAYHGIPQSMLKPDYDARLKILNEFLSLYKEMAERGSRK